MVFGSLSSSSSEDLNLDVNTVQAIVNQIVSNDKYRFDESGSPKLNPKYFETEAGFIIDPDTPNDGKQNVQYPVQSMTQRLVIGLNDLLKNAYPNPIDIINAFKQSYVFLCIS